MAATPQKLNWIKLNQRLALQHPVKGRLEGRVLGKYVFAELWQQTRGPQVPWTPTGNAYLGAWLEGGIFLLNWQNRYYVLDQRTELSDNDIQRDFMPHARKFAQSDQTAAVHFDYPPAVWRIDDIGKFQVSGAEGQGLPLRPGASGRFIHCSGDSRRALVVEDYEGAGGRDAAWVGCLLEETDIKPA
jgi:hypothetical protein